MIMRLDVLDRGPPLMSRTMMTRLGIHVLCGTHTINIKMLEVKGQSVVPKRPRGHYTMQVDDCRYVPKLLELLPAKPVPMLKAVEFVVFKTKEGCYPSIRSKNKT